MDICSIDINVICSMPLPPWKLKQEKLRIENQLGKNEANGAGKFSRVLMLCNDLMNPGIDCQTPSDSESNSAGCESILMFVNHVQSFSLFFLHTIAMVYALQCQYFTRFGNTCMCFLICMHMCITFEDKRRFLNFAFLPASLSAFKLSSTFL